ncbi:MAG TPA: hypothetical protein VFV99_01610 [Kofleriaceae bacterium]|nr:hypothetical protein [Kofleriaceae bacterium]
MELETLEALALADNRAAALSQLLPGSEDHDYYRCLHAQHRGAFDEAQVILDAWHERHGDTERYRRMRLRQFWYRLGTSPDTAADDIRDLYGVSHWHEADAPDVDPSRPTKLAAGAFTGDKLLTEAMSWTDLSQVTDEGLYELLDRTLDATQRRALLSRIGHTPHERLVTLIHEDLEARGSGGFGSLNLHHQLTLDQLHALVKLDTKLLTNRAWVEAVVRRMRPPAGVDIELDRDAREAYLRELWQFLRPLPATNNGLKEHVLWHLLDTLRQRNAPVDSGLFAEYLQLPRSAAYVARDWLNGKRSDEIAARGVDWRNVTGLPPAGDDEALVRDYLQRQVVTRGDAEQYAQWLDRTWLDGEIATAQLLNGAGDTDRATLVLGPTRAAALRDRVDLVWCLHNPTRFAVDEPIILEADVKNVPELVVKVFRIDPLAYFQTNRKEISTDVDLDGLAASHELVLRYSEPPIRRVRRRIELPMCTRGGSYVIDLIGNGMSSRAVIHKGRLRHVARIGAAGHAVTVVDEQGRLRADTRAWIGDREYIPDPNGTFVVPFSTSPTRTPMLLSCGDIATVQYLDLVREQYDLTLDLHVDRQALISGATAHAIARVQLTVSGQPVSLAALEQPRWEITLTDRHGVPTTKQQPLTLSDDDAAVLDIPVGEATDQIMVRVSGKLRVVSEQRDLDLSAVQRASLASMHGGLATDALYLAHTASGWVLSALGKTGEPRAQRSLTVTLVHRWARTQLNVELATDAHGRCELGELPGIERITATFGSVPQTWWLTSGGRPAQTIQVAPDTEIAIALPPDRDAHDVISRASIVEVRGGYPVRHPNVTLEPLTGGIVVRGLLVGEYAVRAPGLSEVIIRVAAGTEISGHILAPGETVGVSRLAPVIAELTASDALHVRVVGASSRTRVHVIATRFVSAPFAKPEYRLRTPLYRIDRARGALYVSGRELGDEYRYVLERRNARRFPSLLLDKPSLLLNPWARRTTSTDVAVAAAGRAFAAAPGGAPGAGYGGPMQARGEPAVDESAYLGYDFLAEPARVFANLTVDAHGALTLPLAELGNATSVSVIVDDPAGTSRRHLALAESPLATRDLRLHIALAPESHVTQHKTIRPLLPGNAIVIEDLATAKLHLIDSVERAHAYLLALRDDATLREFSFVTRWHTLADTERRELYSKYACHELHLFLYCKDRAFFDAVVRPYLVHKRTKTFLDHWLLDVDLASYLEPMRLARLNAVERALLAQRLLGDAALVRQLADEVGVQPPNPELDTRIIDALLGASTLEGGSELQTLQQHAVTTRQTMVMAEVATMAAPQAPPAPAPKRRAEAKKMSKSIAAEEEYDALDMDLERRRAEAPMYRVVDKTQEWAENNWWHQTPQQSGADLIEPNRLWRDLALHRDGVFLSQWLGLATNNFAEAMCALALVDLPFVAGSHQLAPDGPRLTITAAANTLAGTSQLVPGELVETGAPLVVGQSYVRTDDRYRYVDGEQVDKYIEGSFIAGVVYTCQVVLANPTSSRQRIAALIQIPRGSISLAGALATQTLDIALDPYGTHGHEYAFYFPAPGRYGHFPVHVSRGGAIVAAAPGRVLEVTLGGDVLDPQSWAHISQRGSVADVVAFLDQQSLADVDLERVAWRLRDRAAYDAILGALERRRVYAPVLWGYALLHRDPPRIHIWARALGAALLGAGPVLDMPVLGLDAEALDGYEHLELAPLINARAHRLGPKLRILNDGLAAQYTRFLELVAHRPLPTSEDMLAAAHYLLAQDRADGALAALGRVDVTQLADRMQHDYLAAYTSCLIGDITRARELTARWRELRVDRWSHKFSALANMLDELTGAAPSVVDALSRDQQQAELAAKQPTFDIALDREGVLIRNQHVTSLELRFFEMDVELLFSRQPFVQSDVSRFSFIEPGHREYLTNPPAEHRVAWPPALRGKNVVVEAVGVGQRKARIHYANDLATYVAHQYGQVRVQRASDHAALAATYVKVYAQKHGGAVAFYKDGYTDLRGWFDYASLSTNDLDHVEKFAILVSSDQSGSAILEAGPPAR